MHTDLQDELLNACLIVSGLAVLVMTVVHEMELIHSASEAPSWLVRGPSTKRTQEVWNLRGVRMIDSRSRYPSIHLRRSTGSNYEP